MSDVELFVMRHSYTKKGKERGRGSHLSTEGINLAQQVGKRLGNFDYVCTSVSPRAVETAIAMGCSVDDTFEFATTYVPGEFEHHEQWSWQNPFSEFSKRVHSSNNRLAEMAVADTATWLEIAQRCPKNGKALIVSHGGSIEPVLVYCCPDEVSDSWGPPFSHRDGVSLRLCNSSLIKPKLIRA